MAKKRRRTHIPTPSWHEQTGAIRSRVFGRGSQFYGAVAVGALLAIALVIVGYGFLTDYLETQGRPGSTALQVGDTDFRLDYYTQRLKIYVDRNGGQGAVQPEAAVPAVSDTLVKEEIVRRYADEKDVSATDDEIDAKIATRLGIKADDENFDTVFEQELARSGLTEDEYRNMIEAEVLTDNLQAKFQAEVPTSAESVRYRQIVASSEDEAADLRTQIEGGADFATLAKEKSLDTITKDKGGEVGWMPRGALDPSVEELVFALDVGELTVVPTSQGVLLIEMEEKADDQAVAEDKKADLAKRALDAWVEEKKDSLDILDNMDITAGDQDKIGWALKRVYTG